MQKSVEDFHLKSISGATMMIIPHSRGAVYTRNAMMECCQELRDRVDIRAFAPGAYIDPYLCHSIRHYESRDIVPLLDYSGRQRCKDTIIRLTPHSDAALLDHGFTSYTYADTHRREIEGYLNK